MEYYLIDLERSVGSGMVHYWKPMKRGYTRDLVEAGRYSEEEAMELVQTDFDRRTVMVATETVKNIIKA